jgi:hypothetical protein
MINESLTALNLAKYEDQCQHPVADLPQDLFPSRILPGVLLEQWI